MAIETAEFHQYKIITPEDNLDNNDNIQEFEGIFKDLIQSDSSHLAFDFSNVRYLPSRAVGLIIKLHQQCQSQGGEVVLVNPHEDLMNIFNVVGIKKILRIVKKKEQLLS